MSVHRYDPTIPRVQLVEKNGSLAEVEIAKARAEKEAAIQAKLSLQEELDRNRKQQGTYRTRIHECVTCSGSHAVDAWMQNQTRAA